MSLPIHPETKVGALLDAYPGIDDVLIEWVPAFAKLKNPILRKTVAKAATLEQAAKIGGVSVREMVQRLREAVGQSGAVAEGGPAAEAGDGAAPAWLNEEMVRHQIDADAMLETGLHPIGRVRQCVATLQDGEMVRLVSSFRPEPLIDTFRRGGLGVYSAEITPGRHATYICRIGGR